MDVRDSLASVSVCAQGKWTLVSTRKARAEARCGKVGRSRGRPRVPSAWTVCKNGSEGKRFLCTLCHNFF